MRPDQRYGQRRQHVLPEPATPPTVTTKGQVTFPKPVRGLIGINPGSSVSFGVTDDGRVIPRTAGNRIAARPPSRFAKLRGTASAGLTTDEIMALTRGDD